jgi:hypothetical protein
MRNPHAGLLNHEGDFTMAEASTLHDAFVDELRDIYDGERNSPRLSQN